MKRRLPTAILAGLAMVLLAGSGPSVLAQPVATIALPAPGNAEQLFSGCNNISLTFPDGTPSQTVVQAVTPAGTVETLWRFNGPLNRFEGFSPAYPQASDLTSVNFLDAVWLCMAEAPPGGVAPPAPAAPTPTPPAQVIPPAPLPSGPTADVVPTDLYADNQPQGVMWIRITNNGPDILNNKVSVTVSETRTTLTVPPVVDTSVLPPIEYSIGNFPGETYSLSLGLQIDTSHYRYDFTVTVTPVDFTDPNMGNNTYTESVEPIMASLALTNASGADISSIQFRLVGDPSWTNMLAFGELVLVGQTRNWQIPAAAYDLRAYIGDQVLDERLNVGISGTYDWTVLAALDIHNSPPNWWPIEEVYIYPPGAPDNGPNWLNPGETIPPGAVRRFKLAPGVYQFLVLGPGGDFPRGHYPSAVAGVCAWFPGTSILDPGVFTCVP